MPAVSKDQQRLMGQAWAIRKGTLKRKDANDKAKKLADSKMKDKDMKAFASTKHKGLPEYVHEMMAMNESKTPWNNMKQYANSWMRQEWKKSDMLMVITKTIEGFMQEIHERLDLENTSPKERKDAEEILAILDEMLEIALD